MPTPDHIDDALTALSTIVSRMEPTQNAAGEQVYVIRTDRALPEHLMAKTRSVMEGMRREIEWRRSPHA